MFENVSEIILKVTRDCNLRCEYCYIKDKDIYKNERMSLETFQQIIERVVTDKAKNIRSSQSQQLQIVFHGGEPTLMPIEILEQFINYAQEKIPLVSFGMQTNMTKLTPDWLSFLKKHQIRPGISIDGFETTDNKLRTSTQELTQKLDMLNAAGVGYGPLMVLSKTNVKNFFKNAQAIIKHAQVAKIKANYAENTKINKTAYPEVSAQDLYTYVFLPIMQHFLKNNSCLEENIEHYLTNYINKLIFSTTTNNKQPCQNNCLSRFCGGGNNVIEVDADGNICFCGRWSDVNPINKIGTITEADPFGLVSYYRGLRLHLEKTHSLKTNNCQHCSAQAICTYSCLAFAYDKYGDFRIRQDLVCTYMKKILKFFEKNKYILLLHYVKGNPWEVRETQQYYFLNIPLLNQGLRLREKITDSFLVWVTLDHKIYLRLDKKALRGKQVKL